MTGRIITGIEKDRAIIRGAALNVIRQIIEKPKLKISDARKDWLAPPAWEAFRRLEPLGFGLTEENWWVFNPNDCTPDLVWPLDVGIVCEHAGIEDDLRLSRAYTVTPKMTRGYASRFSPFMVRCDYAQMDRGKMLSAAGLWVWLGGKWVDAQKRTLWSSGDPDVAIPNRNRAFDARDGESINLATSVALRQRYEWAVSLGLENSPSVRFATDPTGIKEVFKVRDLPEGRDRREALLTWVCDHWRQNRHDPDIEIYVRKHIRGAVNFTWRNMQVEIIPSQFDIDQRDKLIAEREAMHIAGKDRRTRV